MRDYSYSFIKFGKFPTYLINPMVLIAKLKTLAELHKENYEDLYDKLAKLARYESIKASNAIENITVSEKRLNEIINLSSKPLTNNEAEIAGYKEALDYIYNNYDHISVNEETILYLHSLLMKCSNNPDKGQYKNKDNFIIAIDKFGNKSIRFKPVSAKDTPSSMEQLLLSFQHIYSDCSINQLLLIPCFILDFLCIHPFNDGNGRMSRLLTNLLLLKAGYKIVKYISFENQINKARNDYYEALESSSINWAENENDYNEFIYNFIFTLLRCYNELDVRFDVVHSKKVSKKDRIQQTIFKSIVPISKKEICSILLDVSPTTVEQVLSQLKKDGKIRLIGSSRNTKYIKSNR